MAGQLSWVVAFDTIKVGIYEAQPQFQTVEACFQLIPDTLEGSSTMVGWTGIRHRLAGLTSSVVTP